MIRAALLCWAVAVADRASAQVIEAVGLRAQGMGGAFVAVANDSSATWWNPAGLSVGQFADASVASGKGRDVWAASVAVPSLGGSYYQVRARPAAALTPTGGVQAGRQEGRVGVLPESLRIHQIGATVVQSVFPQVHVGATFKHVRGDASGLDAAGAEPSGVDFDIGVLGGLGAVRAGLVARNLLQPVVWAGLGGRGHMGMPRQVRVGAAFDGDRLPVDRVVPVVVSFDADLRAYETIRGARRVVAIGAERWLHGRRLAIRGGARFNTAGARERLGTVGGSVALARGVVAESFAVVGTPAERGWGLGLRASF